MPFGNWPMEKQKESGNEATDRFLSFIISEIKLAQQEGRWEEEDIKPFFQQFLTRYFAFFLFAFADQSLAEKREAIALLKEMIEKALAVTSVQLILKGEGK